MSGRGVGSDTEEALHAYLRALLPAGEVDPALAEVRGSQAPFVAARDLVHARLRVAPAVEADVLVRDAGLSVDDAAVLTGLSAQEVRDAVSAADTAAAELGLGRPPEAVPSPPPPPTPPEDPRPDVPAVRTPIVIVDDTGEPLEVSERPVRGRRRLGWFSVLALAVAIAAAVLLLPGRGPGCTAETPDVAGAPIEVTRACVTDTVDASGAPGPERTAFRVGAPIRLWFAYDRREPRDVVLTLVVLRDGRALEPAPQFGLPDNCPDGPCEHAHVPIPAPLVAEPGDYRVEVRWDGETLLAGSFTVSR